MALSRRRRALGPGQDEDAAVVVEPNGDTEASESDKKAASPVWWRRQPSKRFLFLALIVGYVLGKHIWLPHYTLITNYLPQDNFLVRFFPSITPPAYFDILNNLSDLLTPFQSWNDAPVDPGKIAASQNWTAHYPVVIMPGLISTGLELWKGHSCSSDYFRQRLWGSTTMLRFLLLDKVCWLKHIIMDRCTGLDPENVKLRPAQGLEAADYLLPGYWVWGRIIEALGEIGYDNNNLHLAAYDWRLRPENMELRDHYFSRLKVYFETSLQIHGKKAVLISHSMGALIALYFMKWVESEAGGKGGKNWVDKHIQSYINIAGSLLGTPKPISGILSGEAHDTVQLGLLEAYLLDNFMSARERTIMARHWPGFFGPLPKGGNQIWGNRTHPGLDQQNGLMIKGINDAHSQLGWTIEDTINMMYHSTLLPDYTMKSIGHPDTFLMPKKDEPLVNDDNPAYWTNPLQIELPSSPSGQLRIYCVYGVGKKTERSYHYQYVNASSPISNFTARATRHESCNDVDNALYHSPTININTKVNDLAQNVTKGIQYTDGDGTVPLLSMGVMCVHGWKSAKYNPSGIAVVTREYFHQPLGLSVSTVRGGPRTSDHVDILGNYDMTMDILKIASGHTLDEDIIHSNLLNFTNIFE